MRSPAYNQKILHELGIDISHCRHFEGENGFAMVTLKGNDRVFLGSNKAASPKSTASTSRRKIWSTSKASI